MKRVFLILPLSVLLSGCIVYSPTPTTGQYGFTYDYSVPIAEGVPTRTLSSPAIVSADIAPDVPPRVPPIYSEIPEPTPERTAVVPDTRAVIVSPQPVIQEAAGAEITTPAVPVQPPVAVPTADSFVSGGGGIPFDDDDDTNNIGTNTTGVVTNTNNTVGVITNTNNTVGVITNTNNTVGVITNTNNTVGVITNNNTAGVNTNISTEQSFGVLPGQNIKEAAGAGEPNAPDIPNRLPPAPRLSAPPTSPRANQAGTEPISSPTPTSPLPQQNPLPQQIQQQNQQQQQQAPQQQQTPQSGTQKQPYAPVAPQ